QDALDDDHDGVAGQQRHRRALVAAQPLHEQPVDHDPDDEHHRDRDQQPDEQVDVQVHGEQVAEISSEDDQDALGDVDDVEHPEDQRQADRHQRVDTAAEYSVEDRPHE